MNGHKNKTQKFKTLQFWKIFVRLVFRINSLIGDRFLNLTSQVEFFNEIK